MSEKYRSNLEKKNNKKNQASNKQLARVFVLLSQLGLTMVSCIFVGFFIGIWLDKFFGKEYVFLVLFILIGIFSGFYQCYRLITKELNL